MAKVLNTSGTNYYLEELIKSATERLILISPFLKLNDRMKELLADKDRLKIDVRIVYGKSELHPEEINWLKELIYIRTSFCKNLHAKMYINENSCIITSLNLYEFSMINNNEIGVYLERAEDAEMYRDAYEEAQRIIRISDEIRISLEKVSNSNDAVRISLEKVDIASKEDAKPLSNRANMISTSKMAKMHRLSTADFLNKMVSMKILSMNEGAHKLTSHGKAIGAEFVPKSRFGAYFKWPDTLQIN